MRLDDAKSVFYVVTARTSAFTKLRMSGWIGWSGVYTLERSGPRPLRYGRAFLCDRHILIFIPSSTLKRRFSSRVETIVEQRYAL